MANPNGHDPTTGLPDRLLLHDRLAQALAQSRRRHGVLALIRIDLEGFEPCDGLLGEGDRERMLREIATQLRAQLRASDTIGRIEGGFVLILPELSDGQAADLVAGKMAAILKGGLALEGRTFRPRASLGIAVFPGDGDNPAQLLRNAGIAAANARAAGVRLQRFASATPGPPEPRQDLTRDLGRAIEQGQLRLEYQPQIELRQGRPVGFEALLRWRHPSRGDVAPEIFVEVAEASGQIGRIGKWALAQACAAAARWPVAPYGPLRVAVNFSALQTTGDDFPLVVARALESSRLAAPRLEFEITERSVLDREGVTAVLARLRTMGVRLALDDFGMGFASLRHLGGLPLDALKIDRSFVAGLESTPGHAIVQCVVELAHRMGLRVVAEGVESDSQLATLRRLGCDEAQGHVLGRPLAEAEVAPWLLSRVERRR